MLKPPWAWAVDAPRPVVNVAAMPIARTARFHNARFLVAPRTTGLLNLRAA